MRFDNDAFKAEVYRRGREKVAARKRARKRILISCASITACLALFVALSPSFGWWDSLEEVNNFSADQIMPNEPLGEPADGLPAGEKSDEILKPNETYAELNPLPSIEAEPSPDMNDADMNNADDEESSYITSVYSVEVTAQEDGGDSLLHTDPNHLVEIGSLLQSINESDRDELPDPSVGESETGYRITVTYRYDDQDEYIWSGTSWTIVEEERTVALTAEETEALTELLLQSEAN